MKTEDEGLFPRVGKVIPAIADAFFMGNIFFPVKSVMVSQF